MKHILIAALLCSALMATDKEPVPACSDVPKGTYPCTYKSDCNTCTLWNKYGGECTAMTCGELLPFVGSTQTVRVGFPRSHSERVTKTVTVKGKEYHRVESVEVFDYSPGVGTYVVTATEFPGGGTGHGPHDIFPNGHKVTASRLMRNGNLSRKDTISFYQSGCFNAMIEDVPVIRRMKMKFEAAG